MSHPDPGMPERRAEEIELLDARAERAFEEIGTSFVMSSKERRARVLSAISGGTAALGLVTMVSACAPSSPAPIAPAPSVEVAAPAEPAATTAPSSGAPASSTASGAPSPTASCGASIDDWCPAPAGDPCGAHRDVASCKADSRCGGMAYTGESLVACKRDARGFGENCPTVGCVSLAPKP
jgi:hypothetical protein